MKIKKVVCAALILSLSMSLLACAPENKINAYGENNGSPIEIVRDPKIGDENHQNVTILRDTETGVEYIYIYNRPYGDTASSCAICPRLNRNGQPFTSR